MKRLRRTLINNWMFILILVLASFLRLYNLPETVMFLGDQGRDAIVIFKIVQFKHFPAIGPTSSVGGIFLGPFYYYLMAPFLLLFNFNPVGLAYGVALLSILGLIFIYIISKKIFNKQVALILSFLITFSRVNINLSRYSWNPNLLPVFSFLTLFFLYKALEENKNMKIKSFYTVFFGLFLGFSLQLHYLAGVLVVTSFVFVLIMILSKRNFKIISLKQIVLIISSFIFTISPLILFDLKNRFLNTKNLLKLFTKQQSIKVKPSYFSRVLEVNKNLWSYILNTNINISHSSVLLIIILTITIFLIFKFKNDFLVLQLVNVLLFILIFSLLFTPRHLHYYTVVYYSVFLLISVDVYYLFNSSYIRWLLTGLVLSIYLFLNLKNVSNFFKGDNQIRYSKRVADVLSQKIGNKPYNIASWPIQFSVDNFVYFLTLEGKEPADKHKVEITNQMFVLCKDEPCLVLNSPSWDISMFGKAKIDKIWKVDDIKIYKLVHDR